MRSKVFHWAAGGLVFLLVAAVGYAILQPLFHGIPSTPVAQSLSQWTFRYEDGTEEKASAPIALPEGHSYVDASITLPESFDQPQILMYWTYFQEVKVWAGQRQLYSWGKEQTIPFGKAVPCKRHRVNLPGGLAGKELRLRLKMPYSNYPLYFDHVVYGDADALDMWVVQHAAGGEIGRCLLLGAGVFFFIISFFQKGGKKIRWQYRYFSWTILSITVFLQFINSCTPIIWLNDYADTLIGCLSFLVLPMPFLLYLRSCVSDARWLVNICNVLLALQVGNLVLSVFLQMFGILDLPENYKTAQLLCIAAVGTLALSICYFRFWRKYHFQKTELAGFFILLFCTAWEFACFYFFASSGIKPGFVLHAGVLAFVLVSAYSEICRGHREVIQTKHIHDENANLRLQLLTEQIQPHFINNTLGAIQMMIKEDPDQAYCMLHDFSKYIRNNITRTNYTRLIPFAQELDYIQTYLRLEKLRFGDRLQVVFDIQETCFAVLPLTIQPFVENAVKHGVLPVKQGGTVSIRTRLVNQEYLIEIQDNGRGFDVKKFMSQMDAARSVGIQSALIRLRTQNARCQIESSTEEGKSGTTVHIYIPVAARGKINSENNSGR